MGKVRCGPEPRWRGPRRARPSGEKSWRLRSPPASCPAPPLSCPRAGKMRGVPSVSSFKLTLLSLWALVASYVVHRSTFHDVLCFLII